MIIECAASWVKMASSRKRGHYVAQVTFPVATLLLLLATRWPLANDMPHTAVLERYAAPRCLWHWFDTCLCSMQASMHARMRCRIAPHVWPRPPTCMITDGCHTQPPTVLFFIIIVLPPPVFALQSRPLCRCPSRSAAFAPKIRHRSGQCANRHARTFCEQESTQSRNVDIIATHVASSGCGSDPFAVTELYGRPARRAITRDSTRHEIPK
jgi:hypothetical protein